MVTAPKLPTASEREAIAAISAVLGCEVRQRDPGGGALQLHDFELEFSDGRVEAVEVTEAALQPMREAMAAHGRKVGYRLPAHGIRHIWSVHPTVRARFARWNPAALGALLGELEGRSKLRFFYATDLRSDKPLQRLVHEFGICWGTAFVSEHEPYVQVWPPSDHRVWCSNRDDPGCNAVDTLLLEAGKRHNQAKLQRSGAAERHPFVWVPEDNYLPWRDLDYGVLPKELPSIPDAITTAWLGARTSSGKVVLWRLRQRTGWDELVV